MNKNHRIDPIHSFFKLVTNLFIRNLFTLKVDHAYYNLHIILDPMVNFMQKQLLRFRIVSWTLPVSIFVAIYNLML